jgi:hypothetical protein
MANKREYKKSNKTFSDPELFKPIKQKTSQEERDKLMQEFLSKGGTIKKVKPGIAKGASSLNRNKELQWSEKDITNQKNNENYIPSEHTDI